MLDVKSYRLILIINILVWSSRPDSWILSKGMFDGPQTGKPDELQTSRPNKPDGPLAGSLNGPL